MSCLSLVHELFIEQGGYRSLKNADLVIIAIGFTGPVTNTLTEQLGLEMTQRGAIQVGDDYQSSVDGVYAAGDALGVITGQDLGLDPRAWLNWYNGLTDDPFKDRQEYLYPTYQRDEYGADLDPDKITEALTIVRLDGSGAMIRDAK